MTKKILICALVAACVVAFTIPASALENQFGGYWRTRVYTQQNFTGEDETEASDVTQADTRTRLYYTAVINDNLKLVNKFEMDATFGMTAAGGRGDVGADDTSLEIKNTYADFTLTQIPLNFKVGTTAWKAGRGFLFDDDFSGAVIDYKGDNFNVAGVWVKAYEAGAAGAAGIKDYNDFDVDYYSLSGSVKIDDITISPYYLGVFSDDGSLYQANTKIFTETISTAVKDITAHFLGVDVDVKIDKAVIFFTGIYESGTIDWQSGANDSDIGAYLLNLGGSYDLDIASVHGEALLISGDDNTDNDADLFIAPKGQTHYWAEILGGGTFDGQNPSNAVYSANGPFNNTNIMAFNLGAGFDPIEKLKLAGDLWYAQTAEDITLSDGTKDSDLGIEIDLKGTYELVENLNLDLIIAYLIAGDVITNNSTNDANPYEVGMRLSLSF